VKTELIRVGSVALVAEASKNRLELAMTSDLGGMARQIGCLVMFEDIATFKKRVLAVLKETE
jgi:hypothetical protein